MHRFISLMIFVAAFATPVNGQSAPAPRGPTAFVSAETFDVAVQRITAIAELVAAVEGAPPALALVMVRRGQTPTVWVRGRLAADADTLASADTPFYIASQTKAFVGLLAIKLDARGVFDLDQTLADVWPQLTLPGRADPHTITFRQLLSHQGAFDNEALLFRTSYTDFVPAAEYEHLLSEGSARAPGFNYSNIGYVVYGAALKLQTGRDWRDWIDTELFQPAGMTHSGAFASRLPVSELPHYHRWLADAGWDTFAPKPDDLMHAAGGLNMSPNDMARWLDIQLGAPNDAVNAEWLRASHALQIRATIPGDAIECQGYAIGWNVCRIGALDVLVHGGSYTGVRSVMAVSPELEVGIAFFSNSDSLTGSLGQTLTKLFFEMVQDPVAERQSVDAFAADYATRLRSFAEGRVRRAAQQRSEGQWRGWQWRPTFSERAAYTGQYRHPLFGLVTVVEEGDVLHARLGVMNVVLEPASLDLFGVSDGAAAPPTPIRFRRVRNRIGALTWAGKRFERVG